MRISQTIPISSSQPAAPVEMEGIACFFGKIKVVRDINLTLHPGEHVALIGSNGSGKTTLLRTILGLHPLAAGTILVDGLSARTNPEWQARRKRIAWMPQRQATGQFPLLVSELLASSSGVAAALQAAIDLEIGDLLARPISSLSGGQLQRVFLARSIGSLAGGAGLLLADEPTAALDFDGQVKVADILRTLPATCLVVTHDHKMAERCDRVIEMAGGCLYTSVRS